MEYNNQVLQQFSYARFWTRFAAWGVDAIILSIPGILISGIFFNEWNLLNRSEIVNYIMGIIGLFYFAIMESSTHQATLGKLALGIKVIDLGGNRISFWRASGRNLGKVLSGLILGFGYFAIVFTEKKQGLHDILVKCLVVNKK